MKKKTILRSIFFLLLTFCLIHFNTIDSYASDFHFAPDTDGELVVVIDPGHGGENLGADYNGFLEKEMNMVVAQAMYDELTKFDGITVYMTRSEDADLSLKERADFAASVNADFLFCLHFNMSPSNNLFGSEVWVSLDGYENREGYRFGAVQLSAMKEMGMYIRGVKTRIGDGGVDYYGILRHCTENGITSALIEHGHVDHEKDAPFCDSAAELQAFGKADAHSAAKFFGLSSTELGISYADYTNIPEVSDNKVYMQPDDTNPDICYLYTDSCDYETGEISLTLTASDPDSPMLYYSYSLDGGLSFTPLLPWPEADMLKGYSPDTFQFTVQVPENTIPRIMVRAYNQYDHFAESNVLDEFQAFISPEKEDSTENTADESAVTPETNTDETADHTTSQTEEAEDALAQPTGEENTFLTFLKISLGCAALLFVILLITKTAQSKKQKGKRRKRAKSHNKRR